MSGVGRKAETEEHVLHLLCASMPAYPILAVHDPPSLDPAAPQLCVCVKCQSTLDTAAAPGPGTFVCSTCRELLLSSPRDPPIDTREVRFDVFTRPPSRDSLPFARLTPDSDDVMLLADVVSQRIPDGSRLSSEPFSKPSMSLRKQALSCITTNPPSVAPPSHSSVLHVTASATISTTAIDSRRQSSKCVVLDPLIDITRLRIRTSSHYCLYPGATFVGTQKSGRSSYDVTVTVVVRSRPSRVPMHVCSDLLRMSTLHRHSCAATCVSGA